ncbi:MAG: hypothetical protein EBU66_12150 [Bacteroidetes bacterium]|nr:hypothetical protein [bacterium]NBP65395.1 hypothetical protein [Bacteroidota bacterium]
MWIEDELTKNSADIRSSITNLSRDYISKIEKTLRSHIRENKQNTTHFFMNFYESLRQSEYELYKQFGLSDANKDIAKNIPYEFTEIHNSANDLPHPRILAELQRTYDRRVRHNSEPENENNRYIPDKVYSYIREKSEYCIRFQANLRGRVVRLYFITFPESHIAVCSSMKHRGSASSSSASYLCSAEIEQYQRHAYKVFCWLSIVSQLASKECSEQLDVYFYMTPFKKERPISRHGGGETEVLSAIHVNTGLTRNCEAHGEIIVYRTEEWFKVFIHESMHNFNMDFIDIDLREANERLRKVFCIPHDDVLLFESYTEAWARNIKIMIDAYFQNDRTQFIYSVREKMTSNALFHIYQMVKVLDIMNLKYSQITVLTPDNLNVCRKQYAEETNVYAYYIFGGILSAYALPFICWCCDHNPGSAIRFRKTSKNLFEFTDFICSAARDPALLSIVDYIEKSAAVVTTQSVLTKTMRMTID